MQAIKIFSQSALDSSNHNDEGLHSLWTDTSFNNLTWARYRVKDNQLNGVLFHHPTDMKLPEATRICADFKVGDTMHHTLLVSLMIQKLALDFHPMGQYSRSIRIGWNKYKQL